MRDGNTIQCPSVPDWHDGVTEPHAPDKKGTTTARAYKLSARNVSLGNAGCNIFPGVYPDVIRKKRGRRKAGRGPRNLEQKGERI